MASIELSPTLPLRETRRLYFEHTQRRQMSVDPGPGGPGRHYESTSSNGYAQFVDLARIRVLVVPVSNGNSGPASQRAEHYIQELSAFSSVPLGDLPPPPKEDSCMCRVAELETTSRLPGTESLTSGRS